MRKKHRSWGEFYIKEILKKYKIKFTQEKKFPDCLSLKNRPLRFDFYLNDYNILIEFQGIHHFKPVNKKYRAKKVHELTVLHDNIKRNYCRRNNIPLIELDYKNIKMIEEDLKNQVNKILGF